MRAAILGCIAGLATGVLVAIGVGRVGETPPVRAQVAQVAPWLVHAPVYDIFGNQASTENSPCQDITVTGSWIICALPAPDREGAWTFKVYSSTRVFSVKGRENPKVVGQ